MISFLDRLHNRVLIFDGAMGTNIHRREPQPADWGGARYENCTDWMVMTQPDWIRDIHRDFLRVGCDAVETDTFGANAIALSEFGLEKHALEINRRAAEIAREAVNEFQHADHPRYVVGSIGPGTKSITLGHVSFDEMVAAYREQCQGLLEGGVDVLLIETCFDVLQAKAAVIAAVEAMESFGSRRPLMVQVTIETTGTMLTGSDIASALTTLDALPVDVIGMNCATGPAEMWEHLQYLSRHSRRPISCLPNAGIPENIEGRAVFPLTPAEFAEALKRFVVELGVNIVGGCCGTTPEHLAAAVRALEGLKPNARRPETEPMVSSLLSAVPLRQDPPPLIIGERTNTTGSRKFKRLLEAGDSDGMVAMAREQQEEGSHLLDVCVAYPGRDEVADMVDFIRRCNQVIALPLVIDTTEPPVMEAALKCISGRPILNSINLEDGRKKLDIVVPLAKKFGAALVALSIDEEGQATTADWKFRVAERIYRICTEEYGIAPESLMFDPLTLPVTTGQEELRNAAVETLEAIRRIKADLPGAGTWLGVSNISFGLDPYARQVVNSVFLRLALDAGLDAAILNASKILPLNEIDEIGRDLAHRLLLNQRDHGDPLQQLIEHYQQRSGGERINRRQRSLGDTVEERLRQAIIQGRREILIADLDAARERYSPLQIINDILLDGMKVVGDLFGSGQMQLPFVLQSAEVMKAAVQHLEQFMEKAAGSEKGRIVLATVKGDVHDIGKNLVDIILSNNGYKVFNLGIKQPIETILHAALEHQVDAIGLSGLLVKSTVVMKENLEVLNQRGIRLPVLCGGAALTRRFVEETLRQTYQGPVHYGEDAFAGLNIMDSLCQGKKSEQVVEKAERIALARPLPRRGRESSLPVSEQGERQQSQVPPAPDIPTPPFFGSRVVTEISLDEVYRFINERTLISTQWQFRKNKVPLAEYARQMQEIAMPTLERLKRQCREERILRPAVVYGYFPCASEGDEVIVFENDRRTERLRFRFPRQPTGERLCLSDYFAPFKGEAVDVLGCFVVTMGSEVSRRTRLLFEQDKYTEYLYLHGFGVELAEALAEYWHRQMRRELGIADQDAEDIWRLFKLHYRGCRYSFGYPACPDLEDQAKLRELLEPERIGVHLTEQFQLEPEQSTSAIVVHHPDAKYFTTSSQTAPETSCS